MGLSILVWYTKHWATTDHVNRCSDLAFNLYKLPYRYVTAEYSSNLEDAL